MIGRVACGELPSNTCFLLGSLALHMSLCRLPQVREHRFRPTPKWGPPVARNCMCGLMKKHR